MRICSLVSAVIILVGCAAAASAQTPASPATAAPGYAWAGACQKCHQDIYTAWERTKHANALDRLSGSEQEKECIGCHVTGPKTRVYEEKKVANAGVQCESCHGPAAAHAADPTVKAGLVKTPKADVCEQCHNEKGPHFKGFYYSAMVSLVHRVPKSGS